MLELLNSVVQTRWIWLALLLIVSLDALLQCLPSATTVILAGVASASGGIDLWQIIFVVGLAAFAGDNLSYRLGRGAGPRLLRRVQRSRKGARCYDWARNTMNAQPTAVIILGRYVSGARLAVMMTAGVSGFSLSRFLRIDAFAAVLWATTTTLTGFFGGMVFVRQPIAGLLLAAGLGLLITVLTRLAMVATTPKLGR